jgi:hypothetical protein
VAVRATLACAHADGAGWLTYIPVAVQTYGRRYGRGEDRHLMIPGWPYSVIAALETGRTSWTAVLNVLRLDPAALLAWVAERTAEVALASLG